MVPTYSAPGVYIEEVPGSGRQILAAGTAETAFVDYFARGPVGVPTRVTGFAEFERLFGGVHPQSAASYAVFQYFLNGGAVAWVVRVDLSADVAACVSLPDENGSPCLDVTAAGPGSWGNALRVAVTAVPGSPGVDLTVAEALADGTPAVREAHRGLPPDAGLAETVNRASSLIRLSYVAELPAPPAVRDLTALSGGADATPIGAGGLAIDASGFREAIGGGLATLEQTERPGFGLLCLPAATALGDRFADTLGRAAELCERRRAFLVIDPPPGPAGASAMAAMAAWAAGLSARSRNAATYWPRLRMPDPLAGAGAARAVGPSGTVAGIVARTDADHGVWRAPAGSGAAVRGADPTVTAGDQDSDLLGPAGVNLVRTLPGYGPVLWGARTLADSTDSVWRYVPVRRTALFIERSVDEGLQWVVFEPNGEPLWAQIRSTVGAFMHGLYQKGAFQGAKPEHAYVVRCDRSTTTQADLDAGMVNVLIGFAPQKPAEFVILHVRLMVGRAG